MKVRKIWIAVLCVVIGVVWWVLRPQSLVHVAGIAEKAEQITLTASVPWMMMWRNAG